MERLRSLLVYVSVTAETRGPEIEVGRRREKEEK